MTFQTKKSLGQHFLRSDRALADITGALPLSAQDTVLEIGPGEGVLTERLLKSGATVVAVEKDDRLIPLLKERFDEAVRQKRFILIHGDIVRQETQETLTLLLPEGWVLIANIPYYITGLILRTFLDGAHKPKAIVLLVQREVAEDIVARDGKESIASIAAKVYGKPQIVARVPRGAFVPPPTVDSAILKITDIRDPFPDDVERERFFATVRTGFASRRKTVLNTLSAQTLEKKNVEEMLSSLKIDPGARPERLTVEDWTRIARALQRRTD